ncbi:MmcQ/YjbR family DNA-binding protein [uncultured Serinicoccus sp.]|uniref:MmcQ/YjbR family DNA-binding protein n=1 Tax=uncultured Serinicoccus sp. TaxID=735514 RepID=UPI00261A8409|nr:MmcQ/YjbR family DNA-binding protein [uncultured Serinicoccus sp.]
MAHPLMVDPESHVLTRLRGICLSLPGAAEKTSHGHPAFYTQRVFAYLGASIKVDGAYERHPEALVVKPHPDEARALLEEPRCFRPAYLGPAGWVAVDLEAGTDWTEVAELVEESYRATAPRRLVAELDTRRGGTA